MSENGQFFVAIWMKFFFLFTPFFVLSMFLSLTAGHTEAQKRRLALQVGGAVAVLCLGIFFFGNVVFSMLGITLDAFRVGAGALLFLSAISLVQAKAAPAECQTDNDIAVVPLAIPITVGPATVGTILILNAELTDMTRQVLGFAGLFSAVICVTILLLLASRLEKILGNRGINILSKITGLVLAALAAHMILAGVQHYQVGNQSHLTHHTATSTSSNSKPFAAISSCDW